MSILFQLSAFLVALIVVAIVSYRLGKTALPVETSTAGASVSRSRVKSSKDQNLEQDLIILKNHTLAEALRFFNRHLQEIPALQRLLQLYQLRRKFPDLSQFRLGPNMFDQIILDWIIIYDAGTGNLVGHGITTSFAWDQKEETLPSGWQAVVRASYLHSEIEQQEVNTLVGLFIFVEDGYRQQGWANNVILEMRNLAQEKGLQALVIPLRPPLRYKKDYATMPMTEFAELKRPDGLPQDHWIRLHTRLGASILRASEKSHQHVLPLQDFQQHFSCAELPPDTGETLVERNGEWYKVYVDQQRDFVLINQGCVWVQHQL